MAVKGQKAKNVGVKKKVAKPKKKSELKYYEPRAQASAAEEKVKNPKDIKGVKSILRLYKPDKTGSIPANQITKLKQQRSKEASQARNKKYKNAPNAPVKAPRGQAAIQAAQNKAKPISLVSTGERAPAKAFGKYRAVSQAVASTSGKKDYRKDFRTVAGTEARNKTIFLSRQSAARKKTK